MIKHSFSDFSYAVNIDSAKKGYKEVLVCYIYNGIEVLRKVYIPEGPGISYIFEARKIIDQEIKDGTLSAYSHKFIAKNRRKRIQPKKVVAAVNEGKPIPTAPAKSDSKWSKIIAYGVGGVGITAAIIMAILLGMNTNKSPYTPVPSDDVIAGYDCELNGSTAKVIDIKLKSGKTKADITKVSFPSTANIGGQTYEVTQIEPAILKGCSNIRTIETPFVGTIKNPSDDQLTMEGRHLIGSLFGDELFEGATSLTYQDHWGPKVDMGSNEGEIQHYLLPFAIPQSLREVVVTANSDIKVGAFSYCTHISHVSIAANATTKIEKYAFRGCHSLNEFEKSRSVTTIEEHAFDDCVSLINFDFTNVATIGDSAFAGCGDMEPIYIPSSVTNIGSNAFSGFSHLIKCQQIAPLETWATDWADADAALMFGLDSPDAPTNVDMDAKFSFYVTTNVLGEKGAYVFEYLGSVEDETIKFPYALESTSNISYPITHIGSQALMQYIHTKTFVFECTSLVSIDSYAFYDCRALTTLQFGSAESSTDVDDFESLKTLGSYAFAACGQLTMDDNNPTNDYTKTFPSSLTDVGDHAFYECYNIKSIDLSGVTKIGASAFEGCYHPYEEVEEGDPIPESGIYSIKVKSDIVLGERAFCDCKKLVTVSYESPVLTNDGEGIELPDYCFYNTSLETFGEDEEVITITSNIKSIGDYCFAGCQNIVEVEIESDSSSKCLLESIGDHAFYDCRKLSAKITVPALDKQDEEGNDLPIMLSKSSFEECQTLVEIEFKGLLGSMPESVFHGCSELKYVAYKAGSPIESIGAHAFANCQSILYLESASGSRVPPTVRSIGDKAFMNCVNMGRNVGLTTRPLRFEFDEDIWDLDKDTLKMGKDVFYGWWDRSSTNPQSIAIATKWFNNKTLYWSNQSGQKWTLNGSGTTSNPYYTSEQDAGEELTVSKV